MRVRNGDFSKLHLHALPQGELKYGIAGRVGEVSQDNSVSYSEDLWVVEEDFGKKNGYATAAISTAIATAIPESACRLICRGPGSDFGRPAVASVTFTSAMKRRTSACDRRRSAPCEAVLCCGSARSRRPWSPAKPYPEAPAYGPCDFDSPNGKGATQQLWLQRSRRSVSGEAELPIVNLILIKPEDHSLTSLFPLVMLP
jgi:hypothetical protein